MTDTPEMKDFLFLLFFVLFSFAVLRFELRVYTWRYFASPFL
jgi:hypothetical protein